MILNTQMRLFGHAGQGCLRGSEELRLPLILLNWVNWGPTISGEITSDILPISSHSVQSLHSSPTLSPTGRYGQGSGQMFKNMLNQYRGALEIISKRIQCLAREYVVPGLSFFLSTVKDQRSVCLTIRFPSAAGSRLWSVHSKRKLLPYLFMFHFRKQCNWGPVSPLLSTVFSGVQMPSAQAEQPSRKPSG